MKTLNQFLNESQDEYWSISTPRSFAMDGETYKDTVSYLKSKGFTPLRSGPGGQVFAKPNNNVYVFVPKGSSRWIAMSSLYVNGPATFGSTFRDIVAQGKGVEITHFLPVSKDVKITPKPNPRVDRSKDPIKLDMVGVDAVPSSVINVIPSQIRDVVVGYHQGPAFKGGDPDKSFLIATTTKIAEKGLDRLEQVFKASVECVGHMTMKRPEGDAKVFVYGIEKLV